ncbi:MAG: hypothetical protein GKR87_03800 [Kiritimatiellae bacterium]|nr:hypothetical protein [Kiritimatiellia bacterium]
MLSMTNRNSNRIQFEYDAAGLLTNIINTLNRSISITYNANGFIQAVTDFSGRSITYQYYNGTEPGGMLGDLKSVTTPAVTGTPTGNGFPNGKTITYTYTTGFSDDRLNHNLLTMTDGRRNNPSDPTFNDGPYLVNVYSTTTDPNDDMFDRVVRQRWGGNIVDIDYVQVQPSPNNANAKIKAIVNDRVGNVSESFYDQGNRKVLVREYTG